MMQFAKCTAAWGGAGSKECLWALTVGTAWDTEVRMRYAPVLLRTQSLWQNVQKWLLDTKRCSLIGSFCFDIFHRNLFYTQKGAQQRHWSDTERAQRMQKVGIVQQLWCWEEWLVQSGKTNTRFCSKFILNKIWSVVVNVDGDFN